MVNLYILIDWLKKMRFFLFLLVLVAAIGGTVLVAKYKPEYFGLTKNISVDKQKEVDEVIVKVSKLIVLPEGENPTLATVTEADKVKGQKFFEKAQNGDKVLVYAQAKKAILYRPSDNKIIEVGVVSISQTDNQNKPTSTTAPTPTSVEVPTTEEQQQ